MQILVLRHDDMADDPRSWDNLGTMVCWRRHSNLGDKHNFANPDDFLEWAKHQNMALLLPLYIYDHGGIGLSLKPYHDPWDSGQVGWVYVTREKLRKEYNVSRVTKKIIEMAEEVIAAEVETYAHYLNRETYGYELWAYSPQERHIKLIDSRWGFYGPDPRENGLLDYVPEIFRPHLSDWDLDNILVEKDGQVTTWRKKDLQGILEREVPSEWINYYQLMATL